MPEEISDPVAIGIALLAVLIPCALILGYALYQRTRGVIFG
jgi:hypothetical protein